MISLRDEESLSISEPTAKGKFPMSNSMRPWWVLLGVICYGLVVKIVFLNGQGKGFSFYSGIRDLLFMGPYLLLAIVVPMAWDNSIRKLIWAVAAIPALLLGIPMAQQGSVKCCAPGQMITASAAILYSQYLLSFVAAAAIFAGWLLSIIIKYWDYWPAQMRRPPGSQSDIAEGVGTRQDFARKESGN